MPPDPRSVHIAVSPNGVAAIKVGGNDVSNAVAHCRIDVGEDRKPTARLTLASLSEMYLAKADVQISEGQQILLKALGWTPPKENS